MARSSIPDAIFGPKRAKEKGARIWSGRPYVRPDRSEGDDVRHQDRNVGLDGEVGHAVAIHVAGQEKVPVRVERLKLAGNAAERRRANPGERVVGAACDGVDGTKVDLVRAM